MQPFIKVFFSDLIAILYLLGRNCWGTLAHPYLTFKRVSRNPQIAPSIVLLVIISLYFIIRAPLVQGLSQGLFQWGLQSLIGILITITSYLLITTLIYLLCRQFSGETIKYRSIFTTWIYSYLPTVIWFAATVFTFITIPPPRQNTLLGITFSVLYTIFSLSLLGWKLLLLWLVFRIPGNLTNKRTFLAMCILIPLLILYSYFLLRLGLWRIPFI